jgi:hypothetical protein
MTRRFAKGSGALIVIALSWTALMFIWHDLRPDDHVRLPGSAWTVIQVNGGPTNGPVVLTFSRSSDMVLAAVFESSHFKLESEYDNDTDGNDIGFFPSDDQHTGCSPEGDAECASLRSTLASVVAWRAPASDRIEFLDGPWGRVLLVATRSRIT